jgi:hypothetical protein
VKLAPLSALALLAVFPLLISCGGGKGTSSVPPPVLNPAVLNGNWLITGTFNDSSSQFLAISLGFSGNEGSAYGDFSFNCSNRAVISGYLMVLTGSVSSDGSFELSTPAGDLPGIVLKGQVPSSASAGFTGTYSYTGGTLGSSTCTLGDSGSFTATAYPAMSGTYSGTIYGQSTNPSFQVSLKLSQGSFGPTPQDPGYVYFLTDTFPADVAATFSGTTCVASGTTNSVTPGVMSGGGFVAHLTMNNGAVYLVSGFFTDSTEQTLIVQIDNTSGVGKCSASGVGTLTRQ